MVRDTEPCGRRAPRAPPPRPRAVRVRPGGAARSRAPNDGRADGKFDGDVQIGVSQFQGTYGLGKSSEPGELDTATLKKLEEMLIFEGKTKLADEIRDIRRNKLKAKEN